MSEAKIIKRNKTREYFEESVQELRKVTWPTRNQAVRLTLLVLGFCVISAIVIGAMDYVFSTGNQLLVNYAASTRASTITEYTDVPVTTDGTTVTIPAADSTSIPVEIPAGTQQ